MVKTCCISLVVVQLRIIEGKLEAELLRITRLRAPNEAVGLILSDGSVVELPNHSDTPESNFEAHRNDLQGIIEHEENWLDIIFWHSHPHGGVGPSRVDMQHKTPLRYHLVVSLIGGIILPSWY